jgi:hypothetical protein
MKDRYAQTSPYTQTILTLITGTLIVLALRLLGTQAPVMVAAAAQGQPSEGVRWSAFFETGDAWRASRSAGSFSRRRTGRFARCPCFARCARSSGTNA